MSFTTGDLDELVTGGLVQSGEVVVELGAGKLLSHFAYCYQMW